MPLLFRKLPLEGNNAHLEAHSISEVMNLLGSVSPDDQHVFPARRIDPRFYLQDLIRTFEDPQHVAIRLRWMHGWLELRLFPATAAATPAVLALAAALLAAAEFSAAVATSAGGRNLARSGFTSEKRQHASHDG